MRIQVLTNLLVKGVVRKNQRLLKIIEVILDMIINQTLIFKFLSSLKSSSDILVNDLSVPPRPLINFDSLLFPVSPPITIPELFNDAIDYDSE